MFHFRISKKCQGKRIQTAISLPKISQPFCNGDAVCWACLLLFCLVLSGPLLTSQQAGCTQKLKELQLFDHLEQGPFFHSQQLTAPKRGKTKFSWRCTAIYYQQLETKKILGNLRKSQLALLFSRFDGLHHNNVLLAFSSVPMKSWLAVGLYCTLWLLDSFQTRILLTAVCLQAENTNAYQSFHSLSLPCKFARIRHFVSLEKAEKIQVAAT